MNEVKVSVCIPVYNGAKFIEEAVYSVLNQNYSDYEIIIVDNNSTDNTVELIKKINSPKITLLQNESNIGLIPNWNKAIENAKGKYIKILPADDFIYQNCINSQCAILDNDVNEKIVMVSGKRNIINEGGKILFTRSFSTKTMQVSGFEVINKNVRSGGNIIGEGGALMFRKNILNKTGLFNSDIFYVLDIDLWYKILLHGDFYFMSEICSAFRVSNSSASVQVVKKQREDVFNFSRKIYLNKEYKVSWLNYKIGILRTFILTIAKKILYKYIVR